MSDPDRTGRLVKRGILVGVVVIVVLNVMGFILDELGGARRGPSSSSYTTSPEGLAAYADLLSRSGHPISRLRSELAEEPPPPDATVVMLDPGAVRHREAHALRSFVEAGGRLLAGGREAPDWLEEIVLTRPVWAPNGPATAGVAAPAVEVDGIDEVRTGEGGSWSDAGSTLPVLAAEGFVTASVESVGRGRVVALADSSVLHNELLDEGDNAAFGIQAAGSPGRPVLFVESIHGYADDQGALGAIPDRWAWALTGLVVAALVYMWAKGRRLGPPEDPQRTLPPPRREYVDALGGILGRTHDVSTVGETLQRGLRHRLAKRAGGATGAADIERAAAAADVREQDVRVLQGRVQSDEELMILARAVATLEKRTKKGSGKR